MNAKSERIDKKRALELARTTAKVIVAKGKTLVTFDMKKSPPADQDLLSVIMGPTGNLRAPTFRIGNTLVVGFNEDIYNRLFAR